MKQYCRYCAHANQIEDTLVYCEISSKVMTDKKAKSTNTCSHFEFNEIDVFGLDKKYKPLSERIEKKVSRGEQLKLEVEK